MVYFFSNNPYIAIIGDMKQSKKMNNRSEVQMKLKDVLNEINHKYWEDISANFIITLGDEFQGLLANGINAMTILSEIERKMYPVKIRFGIGIGAITTDIIREMALGADGPGYYKARSAIEYLKSNEKKKQVVDTDIRFEVDSENPAVTLMLNTIASLLTAIKNAWSERQREIIWNMLEHQDSQIEVAKRLNIKQSSVQKSFSIGNYYTYKEALDTIGEVLKEIRRDDV